MLTQVFVLNTGPLQNGRLTEVPFKGQLVFVVSNPNHLSSIEMCYLFHDLHSLFSFSLGHEPSEENDTSMAIERANLTLTITLKEIKQQR